MYASFENIHRFLANHEPPTPCLVLDVDAVETRYGELAAQFPDAQLCYAVKACPEPAIVRALAMAGASFDVASPAEIKLCLENGAAPTALSYGNTIKKPADIAFAYQRGVRDFVFDAEGDLHHIAREAPTASVSVRVLAQGPESVTPFGRKFGCEPTAAADLLRHARDLGLDAAGVSFHVGSQQLDTAAWDAGIAVAARVLKSVAAHGGTPRRLNIGGGFGVAYTDRAPTLAEYATAIRQATHRYFASPPAELVLEPGRALVADAGLLRTEVVLVARKGADDEHRWVYLDVGRYNGLAETENEAITYAIRPVADGHAVTSEEADGPVIIAGPTCDGDDVLYQHSPYRLPLSLQAGDQLDILSTGAYTASYSSVAFNGIEPLQTYCISGGELIDAHRKAAL